MSGKENNSGIVNGGKFHIYTGDGKGKTTAALGLSLRALGAGWSVFFAQFIKGRHYSELDMLKDLENIEVEQFGRRCFIREKPSEKDIELARKGLEKAGQILKSGDYDLVVLDEATIALHYELFSIDELLEKISARAPEVEVVVTGRSAPDRLIEAADLVTEMTKIKHYFDEEVKARTGIEK